MNKKKSLILIIVGIVFLILGILFFVITDKENNLEEINEDNSTPVYNEEKNLDDLMAENGIKEFEEKINDEYENVNDYLNKYIELQELHGNETGAKTLVSGTVSNASDDSITINYTEIKIVDKAGKLVEIIRLEDEFVLTNEEEMLYYELHIDYNEEYKVSVDFYKHK